jgi:hypothetical protein
MARRRLARALMVALEVSASVTEKEFFIWIRRNPLEKT